MSWEPISTAPKDGRDVLLYGPDGVDRGCWGWEEWRRPYTSEYDNEFATITDPTHWRELPAPPESPNQ